MQYSDFKSAVLEAVNSYLADMDAVYNDPNLTATQKADAFVEVSAKHEVSLEEQLFA